MANRKARRERTVVKNIIINEKSIAIYKVSLEEIFGLFSDYETVKNVMNADDVESLKKNIENAKKIIIKYVPDLTVDFIDELYADEIAEILGELVNANFMSAKGVFMTKLNAMSK